MSDRNRLSVARHYLSALALCAAVVPSAATPSFATISGETGNEGHGMSIDVLSDRSCKRAAKQERCDWVKRDHKLTTGH